MIRYRGYPPHKNIFLDSGYVKRETKHGLETSIMDVKGLHKLIDRLDLDEEGEHEFTYRMCGWRYNRKEKETND